jgi:hypothetical protein
MFGDVLETDRDKAFNRFASGNETVKVIKGGFTRSETDAFKVASNT